MLRFSSHFLLCKVESGMDEYEKTNEVQNNLLGETLFNLLTRYSYLRWCFFVISVTSDTYLRLHTSKESSIIDVDSLSFILSSFMLGYVLVQKLRNKQKMSKLTDINFVGISETFQKHLND